jgi:hypothetical protein
MEWIIGIIIVVYLIDRWLRSHGRTDFWKITRNNRDDSYDFFMDNDCWIVFDEKPIDGYKNNLPNGELDGPFFQFVPKLDKRVRIYGKVGEYEKSQDNFLNQVGLKTKK